jgi:hypothetical protein
MGKLLPYTIRDFKQGRYSPNNVASFLCPVDSVSDCRNVKFNKILGSACVRDGTVRVESAYDVGHFVSPDLAGSGKYGQGFWIMPDVHRLLAVMSDGKLYTRLTQTHPWAASNLTGMNAGTQKDMSRFAVLNGRTFVTSNVGGMHSSVDGTTWTTDDCIPSTVKPSLIFRYQGRLIAAGDPTYPDRIYFSSVVNPAATPFITWNIDPVVGDWIDVNPDDGGNITGFAETSTFLLIFKDTGMYRMSGVDKAVDPDNIFNIGAVSQESIVSCQGVVYFFTGSEIRRTNGGYAELISRSGIQDLLTAMVLTSSDFFVATVSKQNTVLFAKYADPESSIYGQGVVMEFSPDDQSWVVHQYGMWFYGFVWSEDIYYSKILLALVKANTGGTVCVQAMDYGNCSDDLHDGSTPSFVPIDYYLITQEIEFGDRSHWKQISDQIVVFLKAGTGTHLSIILENDEVINVEGSLDEKVNILNNINVSGHYIKLKWYGSRGTGSSLSPILEGFSIPSITDTGLNNG